MRPAFFLPMGIAIAATATANEVVVRNDSLVDNSSGVIVSGFVPGESAASWLTSPCDGSVVAAQIFWASGAGDAEPAIEDTVIVYRAGDFPEPGENEAQIDGPVLNDGFLNEFRYLDEGNTIPLDVAVVQAETFVVSLTFLESPPSVGPSVVRDTDGSTPSGNALYGDIGFGNQWYDAAMIGINGDWVIRAVVDCESIPTAADVAVALAADPPEYTAGAALTYTVTINNAGPAAVTSATVVDAFPADYENVAWTCAASGGASCAPSGTSTIAEVVSLPAGAEVIFTVTGTVASDATAVLTNSATAVVGAPANDPDTTNNTATIETSPVPAD
ncbi:MAG: DUF11 domain-containing protein, partial [Rhodanobacteraceae bacterium]